MPPVNNQEVKAWLQKSIKTAPFLIFSKTTCGFCSNLKVLLEKANFKFVVVEVDQKSNAGQIQTVLQELTGLRTVPQVFVRNNFIGGSEETIKAYENGTLQKHLEEGRQFDYDMIVIGGGSGGLSASKEAARCGAKVAVLDYVVPTPKGTSWGLGGTCVNVGCIPKKLMHQTALLGHCIEDASKFGWKINAHSIRHNWQTMVDNIQNHIGSLNWGYRVALRDNGVEYINSFGKLIDKNTVQCTNRHGDVKDITAETILLATGERPRYLNVPGDKDFCITSDDLFSLPYNPGKTLIVGASYVALECAGFLAAMGNDVTVMVRSIFLRGFDQEMANKVGDYMEKHGVKFIRECIPKKFTQLKPVNLVDKVPGEIEAEGEFVTDKSIHKDMYNTVILAIGRDPCTEKLNLDSIGVARDKVGRVIGDERELSSVDNIYAIGDILSGKLQLTPVAIEAGKNLADRLYGAAETLTNYENVATTVFTPLEYGAIGLTEENAIQRYGERDIEVFHSYFKPLEWTVSEREDNTCYVKLICVKSLNNKVVGFHVLSPNAGEITQGFAIGLRLGATKEDFDRIIGIHPTCAEIFTTLHVTKSSGKSAEVTGC